MSTLATALGLETAHCIAVVGAGGKTALCWQLVRDAASRGERAIFTTTTRIWQPAPGAFDFIHVGQKSDFLRKSDFWRTACLAATVVGPVNPALLPDSFMPVVQTKLAGFPPAEICDLRSQVQWTRFRILVEADGARGLHIKAPAENEPAVPPCADAVCVLTSLDVIGHPLDDRIAHRIDRVARLTRTIPGSIITARLIVDLLADPEGGLKGIPAHAHKVAVLTQHGEAGAHEIASEVLSALVERGYDRAVTIAPRAARPVLATWP
jgi:probable selenium-dependent hydroxylase accessory protein YqeC